MTPQLRNILARARHYWPDARLYREQRWMAESLALNFETVVVSANGMGKDFTAGLLLTLAFLEPWLFFPADYVLDVEKRRKPDQPQWQVHTRRIVSTSVRDDHLDVLWGEIGRFVLTSQVPLIWNGRRGKDDNGAPLIVNHHEIRLVAEVDSANPINFFKGFVSKKEEGMAGHWAAYTFFAADEASGTEDETFKAAQGWAKKFLLWSNPRPCQNHYYRAVKAGDLE